MAVFTTKTKNRLNWKAPEPTPRRLLIANNFYLDIGNFRLLISPFGGARDQTNWQKVTKTR